MKDDIRDKLYRKHKMLFNKRLRRNMTEEESILWNVLRGRRSRGEKFCRQVNIGPYIADFLCRAHRLIVEVDGGIHESREQREHDAGRDAYLRERGFTVVRVKNADVRCGLPAVLDRIHSRLQALSGVVSY
ncbi:MAG: DUF559 domain-containing protein [Candidatus Peribacteraceae bacterium]|jgi:very-short-patch-repair endonuclease